MSLDKVYNVLIVGVGGQGIILASDVRGRVAARYGYDVKRTKSMEWLNVAALFPVM